MDALIALEVIDKAIGVITSLTNALGSSSLVSNIIAKRIAEGRTDWTQAEKDAVAADLAGNKAYAAQILGLDPATGLPLPAGSVGGAAPAPTASAP